jgi:hypothetical protein
MYRELQTFDEVLAVLRGVTGVAKICRTKHNTMSDRRRDVGLFSAQWFFLINRALRRFGVEASWDVFDFHGVKKRPIKGNRLPKWNVDMRNAVLGRKRRKKRL